MASDEVVWQIINQQFCSYKLRTPKGQNFCRNEYNVTGLCSRNGCPLANSRYATVRNDPATGRLYLYLKTIERVHMPNKWWEKIRLPSNYAKALEMLDEKLEYWPKFLVHKCKQRLTRLTQVAIRAERLQVEGERLGEKLVPKLGNKIRRKEATRERKAEAAAKVERAIERELMERLRTGMYGEKPLNVEQRVWERVMNAMEREGELVRDKDYDKGIEELEEDEYDQEEFGKVEYVSDLDSESEDDLQDFEDWIGGSAEREYTDSADETDASAKYDLHGTSDDNSGEESDKLMKAIQNLKRKRGARPSSHPSKKRNKRDPKGPKRQIEYEMEETKELEMV